MGKLDQGRTIPRDDLNVVGLQLEQVHPSINPHVRVLSMQPIHAGAQTLEEPRRYSSHPWGAVAIAHVMELCVDSSLTGCVAGRVNPSEGTEALVRRHGVLCILREGAGQERDRDLDVIDDISLPVPRWRAGLKRAQEDIAIRVLCLSGTTSVEVGQIDNHGRIGNASGVHAEEELEAEVFGSGVHYVEIVLEVRPGGSPATVVDSEGVNTGILGKHHVGGVIEISRLVGDHVVGEDHWRSG